MSVSTRNMSDWNEVVVVREYEISVKLQTRSI